MTSQKTITLITHSTRILSSEKIKSFLRKIFRKERGPDAVLQSLRRGLTELNIPFLIDPPQKKITSIVHVITSTQALKEIINLKLESKIEKIIAGPNLVILPTDENSILLDPAIDIILQPSQWTKKLYEYYAPSISSKIHVWASGVKSIPIIDSKKVYDCLVYQKSAPLELLNQCVQVLKEKNIKFKIIYYGKFKQEDYFNLLSTSNYMIYLSKSESQGIALQEAWIRDVPTLVWNPGCWKYNNHEWRDDMISAPYLDPKAGLFFNDNIKEKLDLFITRLPLFTPRHYVYQSLIDVNTTQDYLKIIQNERTS